MYFQRKVTRFLPCIELTKLLSNPLTPDPFPWKSLSDGNDVYVCDDEERADAVDAGIIGESRVGDARSRGREAGLNPPALGGFCDLFVVGEDAGASGAAMMGGFGRMAGATLIRESVILESPFMLRSSGLSALVMDENDAFLVRLGRGGIEGFTSVGRLGNGGELHK